MESNARQCGRDRAAGHLNNNCTEEGKMDGLFSFLASGAGRVTRAVAGLALIVIGLALIHGVVGWIVAIIGLVPLAAGIFDVCVFAPLFGMPFVGPKLRLLLDTKAQKAR
jgi:hypothetical protein